MRKVPQYPEPCDLKVSQADITVKIGPNRREANAMVAVNSHLRQKYAGKHRHAWLIRMATDYCYDMRRQKTGGCSS